MDIQRLKSLREYYGYSQKQFAEKIDVSINTYRNWEQGKNEPDTCTIIKLAKIFNTTVDYLVGFDKHVSYINNFTKTELNILKITSSLNETGQEQVLSYTEQISELPKYQKDNITYVDKDGFLKVVSQNNDEQSLPYVASSSWKDDHSNDEELADWINQMKEDEIDNQ